jgi:hypothetical protein
MLRNQDMGMSLKAALCLKKRILILQQKLVKWRETVSLLFL